MFYAVVGVLFLSGLGWICLLTIGAPMVSASERQHGLDASRDLVKKLRADRAENRKNIGDIGEKKQAVNVRLNEIRIELRKLEEQISRLPKQVYELTFELGAPEPGMQVFDFIVSRQQRNDPNVLVGPERALWERPRVVRVWAKTKIAATNVANKRFTAPDGFVVRMAERVAG